MRIPTYLAMNIRLMKADRILKPTVVEENRTPMPERHAEEQHADEVRAIDQMDEELKADKQAGRPTRAEPAGDDGLLSRSSRRGGQLE